ncbi:PD-(D/E)XK nuclease family protein [Phocaeicola vulgatus]|jgi:CRISPR/Cas system-associated exonuclease Cas4 (RecB family)|uniref:PD-(D/E)XK nuclease family protein n=1 Tax=Phocaeicola vulgatus TaxID=821 RepID=A0A6I1AWM0_PHOVU|nr:PD-(D/E)XK nuclease family protein [Phocaeicola vulgatus]KAB6594222.1 PD-(D/E)XK nuclease family protein [Phocaeicola vulgatus]KAB6606861.1 PD-(D/E)XK nuclease family protein [Phocaeicola vulgatus]KAB6609414.1 PD-(D/E)XK nuclease family protein [Phocaeicola vulgatus]KAB6614566.1 PD-(D/E)XK nuclease family protein [Phocaeicola vulgatus]KAB6621584.1 PD-(D/E)XK nuclease family protein [Phocaeicola vulgatus]
MESFLKLVAADLYKHTEGNLAHTAVVFPNKRAGLFFNEYLAQESESPIWSPAYVSISELFRSLSPWEVGDPVKLVCELYKIFRRETQSTETLDDFYFWGEMLISDFDDADKNKVDTDKLFSNLQDLRNIMDDYTFIDDEQEEAIRQFFQNFSIERRTALKERFISLWDVLGNIYKGFRESLASQNIAYEGMMYRHVIEHLDVDKLPYEKYVFVGFNVLNKVEHTLFTQLKDAGKAVFYWDYDEFYMKENRQAVTHEAGEFIRRNLRDFPSPLSGELFKNLSKPKEVHYIASSTENAQARYLPQWIRNNLTTPEKETAVVLCNEALLQPVLHSLPAEVKHVNITMGFPLSQTPVYSFLIALLELHTHGFNFKSGRYTFQSVVTLLKHPYTRQLTGQAELLEKELTRNNRFYPLPGELGKDEFLTRLFTPLSGNLNLCIRLSETLQQVAGIYQANTSGTEDTDAFNQLYRESLFKAYTTINRFRTLIEEDELTVQSETFRRLLVKVLSATNIPFHGEPAIGMQVMGVLETRNLDFHHLVLLSVNEGQLPKSGGDSSFIPYNLRKAFGMTTIEHKIAVYAYYFYRLLQRAERITLMYNTSSDGLNRGEWSRFMLQFLIEWPHPITRQFLEAGQSPQGTSPITVEKTPDVMRRMQSLFDVRANPKAKFSPSALNYYLDCPLKFYYRYVAGLSAPDEVSAEIDSATFGSIFHYAAEHIYKDLTTHGKVINKEALETLLRNEVKLQDYVDTAFKKLFFNVPQNEKPEYNGVQLINSAVIARYLKQLLQNDLRYAPFTFIASEMEVDEPIDIQTPKGVIKSRIGGIIDRMDSKDGTLRIVDYKTGGDADTPPHVESLFIPDKKRSNYVFQTFLYAAIMCRKQPTMKIAPALLYIHRAATETYSLVIQMGEPRKPKEAVEDFSKYEKEYRERLQGLLEEIFNPEKSFTQTEIIEKCTYCDFKALCKR